MDDRRGAISLSTTTQKSRKRDMSRSEAAVLKIKDIIEKDKASNERSYASEQGILYGRIRTKK